ncbi:RDD family protein [Paenibacillus solisilvae]|uniref:RDD family protein n=1 Tax=Paenibacillus solisilvae TaxID=2486751 RepID=A0ABW0W2U9_9BACL
MQSHANQKTVSIWVRILSFLWDYILIAGYIILLVGVFYLARPILVPLFTAGPLPSEITGFLFITLPVYLYFAVCEGSKMHATWGKQKMGIIVAGVNGRPFGLGSSLLRSALKFLPWELAHFTIWHMVTPTGYADSIIYALLAAVYGLVIIYLLSPLMSKRNQTVYDFIAGSVVRYKD